MDRSSLAIKKWLPYSLVGGQAARAIGLEYIAITDHSRTLGIAHGLNKEKLEKQKKEIESTNRKMVF